jgi:hypothetical protein
MSQLLTIGYRLWFNSLDCSMSVYLNPPKELAEFPLKRFYRYAVSPSLQFDDNGAVKVHQSLYIPF